jgi:DNA topoisomerase-1
MISPLWEKIARGLSAGRVQSVAVNLWLSVNVKFVHLFQKNTGKFLQILSKKDDIRLEAVKQAGKTLKLKNKAETDALFMY